MHNVVPSLSAITCVGEQNLKDTTGTFPPERCIQIMGLAQGKVAFNQLFDAIVTFVLLMLMSFASRMLFCWKLIVMSAASQEDRFLGFTTDRELISSVPFISPKQQVAVHVFSCDNCLTAHVLLFENPTWARLDIFLLTRA